MKVTMRSIYAGPRGSADAGQVIDLPEDEALALVKGGFAVVFSVPVPETAEAPQPETSDPVSSESATLVPVETAQSAAGKRKRK